MTEDLWTQLTQQLFTPVRANDPCGATGTEIKEEKANCSSPAETRGLDTGGESKRHRISTAQIVESSALCVGMPGAGKSSLLNIYLNPNSDAIPKPTVALEYMFARRSSAANTPKDVAHIWELGGGSHVSDLIKVPITPERFQHALYAVILDLSKPSSVVPHLLHWTEQIKACVKTCVRELAKRDPTFSETLKKNTYAKLGQDHPDLRAVKPCPVPLLIVGNKYDVFKNQESARKRTLVQALRFIAHINGASLLFCSTREKNLKDVFRQTLNSYLFRTAGRRVCETNPEKALVVPAGSDSLEGILKQTPQGTRREDFVSGNVVADGAMKSWRRAVEDVFGAADPYELPTTKPLEDDDDVMRSKGMDSNPFPNPSIDEHRAERDDILRRYRKEAERKAKMSRKTMDPGGSRRSVATSRVTSPPLRRSSRVSSTSESKDSSSRK